MCNFIINEWKLKKSKRKAKILPERERERESLYNANILRKISSNSKKREVIIKNEETQKT